MFAHYKAQKGGYMILLGLWFIAIFGGVTAFLASSVLVQQSDQKTRESRELAVQIAEAGLDYYKWRLAHFPDDLQDGTGGPGPYVHNFDDPEGGTIGQFSLEIAGESQCGIVHAVEITSTGIDNANPGFSKQRTVQGVYARPSVAEYAYILNSNVWAGSDRDITGPYHSNGGIRMDGTNNSLVISGQTDWLCTSSFGCSPNQTVDGVFGGGPNSTLWTFPAPAIDFVGLTIDLINMKALAQTDGLYYDVVAGDPDEVGWHFIFNGDDTVDVYRVTDTDWVWSYHSTNGWQRTYDIIATETLVDDDLPIPADCGLIFAESKVWVEGVISGKVTLAGANVTTAGVDTDLILEDNITYTTYDGTDGLTAIGERSVFVPLLSPNNMEVNGIFIAQLGNFGRNYYTTSGSRDVPSAYNSYVLQDELTINGTIVSNGRVGTKWTCGGTYCSGYANRINSYDRDLATDPPPLTPYVSDDFRFIEWLEVE